MKTRGGEIGGRTIEFFSVKEGIHIYIYTSIHLTTSLSVFLVLQREHQQQD